MLYIIMCGGYYPDFETPRQLLEINKETILGRTVRLLKEAGIDKDHIAISYHDPVFENYALEYGNLMLLKQSEDAVTWEKYDKIFPEVKEECCYIFGDVVFSPAAIKTIVETETDGIEFFASAWPFHEDYIKNWAEPFAFKVKDWERFHKSCRDARALYDNGYLKRGSAWELWQVIQGTKLNTIIEDYKIISDYSCDIDKKSDLDSLQYILRNEVRQ